MSNLQMPTNDQSPSAFNRILQFSWTAIAPHAAITDLSEKRRAQLLNTIALTLAFSFILGLFARPSSVSVFEFMLVISIFSYLLGKSKYANFGAFLFSFGFLSTTYLSLYFGFTTSYSASILSIVPIALIVANALSSPNVFIGLAIYATFAAFLAPQYISIAGIENEATRVGGIVMFIGAVIYGINAFSINLEKSRLKEIRETNQRLENIKTSLEKQTQEYEEEIDTVRQEVRKKTTRLNIISELSQEISASVYKDPKELLMYATQIISDRLGFYHVGIFLLDKNREYAELRAANSIGGQRMLERHHQLKAGGTGIVGYVAQSGYPRIALSTGADAVFFNNLDLPDTKSEMALPLKIGEQTIGVLDVQSTLAAAFNEEDSSTFTTLANQIALVIQNTRLDERAELPSQALRKSGESIKRKDKRDGYVYLADGTIALSQGINSLVLENALALGEAIAQPSLNNSLPVLAVPVKVRDNVVGYIHIEASEKNRTWSEDEIAMVQSVSERAALALENARLFEETEHRAAQEQIMTQMTARIGASNSFERILQTTIQEIGRTLGAKRTFIQLETPSSNEDAATDQGI